VDCTESRRGGCLVGGPQCQGGRCLGLLAPPGAEEVCARPNRQRDQTLRLLRAATSKPAYQPYDLGVEQVCLADEARPNDDPFDSLTLRQRLRSACLS
jgi:hypothetical protein